MKRLRLLTTAAVVVLCAAEARAGGLYFSDRGVRPLSRGGAFVAGADDLGAIWYNPAGVAEAGDTFLFDATWVRFSNEYTRRLRVVDDDGTVRYVDSDPVKGSSPILPLPTIAVSKSLMDGKLVIAGGTYAPYVALASYPEKVNGRPSAARYTLGSFNGSTLLLPGVWVAYKHDDWLEAGLGVNALVGTFVSQLTFSAAPQDRLLGAPEQPEFDAASELRVGPIFAPSANVGFIAKVAPWLRLGASYTLKTKIDSDAKIKVRLPTSAAFDGAEVVGEDARVKFTLPAIFRVGAEVRHDDLRVELSYTREFWSAHDQITATPKDIRIQGITGLPGAVLMPEIVIPRHFRDSSSLHLGGEYTFPVKQYRMGARAGMSYESSAVPREYLSLSSLDFDKITVAIGGSLYIGKRWRFDGVLGHIFAATTTVDPDNAKIGRINPIQKTAPFEPVNGGKYAARADLLGFGLQYTFGADEPVTAPPEEPKPE